MQRLDSVHDNCCSADSVHHAQQLQHTQEDAADPGAWRTRHLLLLFCLQTYILFGACIGAFGLSMYAMKRVLFNNTAGS